MFDILSSLKDTNLIKFFESDRDSFEKYANYSLESHLNNQEFKQGDIIISVSDFIDLYYEICLNPYPYPDSDMAPLVYPDYPKDLNCSYYTPETQSFDTLIELISNGLFGYTIIKDFYYSNDKVRIIKTERFYSEIVNHDSVVSMFENGTIDNPIDCFAWSLSTYDTLEGCFREKTLKKDYIIIKQGTSDLVDTKEGQFVTKNETNFYVKYKNELPTPDVPYIESIETLVETGISLKINSYGSAFSISIYYNGRYLYSENSYKQNLIELFKVLYKNNEFRNKVLWGIMLHNKIPNIEKLTSGIWEPECFISKTINYLTNTKSYVYSYDYVIEALNESKSRKLSNT